MNLIRRAILAAALMAGISPAFAQPAPVPALPDTERRTSYSISASTCACAVNFALYGDGSDFQNWIEVFVNGVRADYTDATRGWTITSPSGSLATLPRPISNAVLTFNAVQTGTVQIVGARRPRRTSQLTENRGVAARDFNQIISDVVATQRETWDKTNDVTGRAVIGLPGEALTTLPPASTRANNFLFFDSGGNPGVASGTTPGAPVTNPNLAPMPANTIKCNNTAGSLAPTDCTAAQANTLTNAADNFFKSGRPWCDVRAQGAVGDGSTNDTAAIQNCVNTISGFGTGGTVFFPPSNSSYCVQGGISLTSGGSVHFVGASGTVSISACQTDVTPLTVAVNYSQVSSLTIIGKGANNDTGTFGATTPALNVGINCVGCQFDHLQIYGGSNAIKVATSDAVFIDINASQSYGSALVYLGHASAVVGNWFIRDKFDQLYPQGYPGPIATINAWASGTAYGLGTIVSSQGDLLQCTQAGTSAGSQPTLKNYGITIADNTAAWQLLAPTNYYSVQIDTNAVENQFVQTDHTGPFKSGMAMTNTLAGTPPSYVLVTNSVIGQNTDSGFNLAAGHDMTIVGSRISGALVTGGAAVLTQSAWTSDLTIEGSSILTGGGSYGVLLGTGVRSIISNNRFSGPAVSMCVRVQGVTDVAVSGNIFSNCAATIQTDAPANYYNIVNNIVHGIAVNDAAGGANKTVSGNN